MSNSVILSTRWTVSQICALTSFIKQINRHIQCNLAIQCPHPAILENNPYLNKVDIQYAAITKIELSLDKSLDIYKNIQNNLNKQLNINITKYENRPNLYLNNKESTWQPVVSPNYWLIDGSANKNNNTKIWHGYQSVIDYFKGHESFVQIGLGEDEHYKLKNSLDMIGQTSLRELILWAYKAKGGIGSPGLLQHLMAAFDKPYFCIMGGIKPISICPYIKHQVFHTIGQLHCCRDTGCYLKELPNKNNTGFQCSNSINKNGYILPKCMDIIRPIEVISSIERFLESSKN